MVALVEKAKNAGISLYPGEIDRLKQRSAIRDGGSPTRYFRRLFEAESKGEPISAGYEPDVIAKLATIYTGYFAPKLAKVLAAHHVDQPKLLHKMLSEMQEALACGAKEEDIVVVPRWELKQTHKWYRPESIEEMRMVAEDQAPMLPSPAPTPQSHTTEQAVEAASIRAGTRVARKASKSTLPPAPTQPAPQKDETPARG
jgi:hypothetical protein